LIHFNTRYPYLQYGFEAHSARLPGDYRILPNAVIRPRQHHVATVYAYTCGTTPGSCVSAPYDLSTAPGGGIAATAAYAEPQGQCPGLDQINVQVPPGLAGKGEVDVVVTVSGVAANTVRVAFK
jgi:uncharacterized protein (TIGR03437 family)